MIFKKNQVIITALVVMVAAAGYLNYADGKVAEPSQVLLNDEGDFSGFVSNYSEESFEEELTIAMEPVTDGVAQEVNATNNSTAGEAVFVNTNSDSSYFTQAKLDREQSRAKQKEMLTEMINNDNIEQGKKTEVADEMLKIQQRIEKETAAEAMIEAKGFKEVYVRIDDETVDIVVNKTELTDSEIAQIEDIIKRKTGVSVDKIRISPIKK